MELDSREVGWIKWILGWGHVNLWIWRTGCSLASVFLGVART